MEERQVGRRGNIAAAGKLKASMAEYFGERDAAATVDDAVASVTPRLQSMGAGRMGYSTSQVGDLVAEAIA